MLLPWHQYLLAILSVLAGAGHINKPGLYEALIPSYIKSPRTVILLSGILHMIFGFMLLIPDNQAFGAWGLVVLFVLSFTILFHLWKNESARSELPRKAVLWLFPLQFLLIFWALQYV